MVSILLEPPIGYRLDGRPIRLARGAEDPEPPAGGAPAGGAPSGGSPAGGAPEWTPPSREDWEATQARQEQLAQQLQQLIAAGTPAAPPAGGAPGDDDDEDEDEKPSGDAEVDKLRRALRTANREAKARRELVEKMQAEQQAEKDARARADAERQAQLDEAAKLTKAAEEARQAAVSQYKPAMIRAAAIPAFIEAGADAGSAANLLRLLDTDTLEVDTASGDVNGLVEQIAAVRNQFPALFVKPEPERPRVPRADGGGSAPVEPEGPRRSADLIARQALNPTG